MTGTEQTLTEALAILGIQHEPSQIEGKRDWYTRSGEYLGAHDAHEGWEYLKRIMKLAAPAREETMEDYIDADGNWK